MKRLLALTIALSLTLASVSAMACIHRMKKQMDPETKLLVNADKDLAKGRYVAALKAAVNVFPKLRAATIPATRTSLDGAGKLRRALTIASVVAVRTGGELGPDGKKVNKRKLQRLNLTWAVAKLEKLSKSRTYDNAIKARWAEGMARVGNIGGALALLDGLARKDMMPDARSLATLAALKSATGDAKGSAAAVKLCKMRTSIKGACELPKIARGTANNGSKVVGVM